MTDTKVRFRPVRCLESDLERMTPIEGHVIFTTDTKKIFVVVNGEFKMMGGSSGIFYGLKNLTDDEKYGDQVLFSFLPTDIDGNELPAEDDLILNIPDGGFYRVKSVNDIDIQAQRIAVSGSGSGGSGSDGPSNDGTLIINYVDATPYKSSTITGVDYYIEFDIEARDSAGDLVNESGSATWIINGKNYYSTVTNGRNAFKVDEYLDPTIGGDGNKITLIVTMNAGGSNNLVQSKSWYVKAVDLKLDWEQSYNETNYISGNTFTLKFIPYGGIDCIAHIIFDDTLISGETYFTKNIPSYETGREVYSDAMPSLSYGAHTCEMYLTAEVNGETYRTPSIFHEITFISGGSSTILTVPYYETTATQYDTLNIPFLVYDPDQESCEVLFLVNDIEVGKDTYNRELHYWPYTLSEYGSIKLTIQSKNNEAKKDIELVINKLDLDVDEVSGSAFSLKANAFSSNGEIREWEQNGVTLSFSDNFDWENGGLQTETLEDGSIQKYICVRQGTRMTVNYNLFQATNTARDGKDFKICFKATNCYDYTAPILECYEEATSLGIKLDAQKGLFSTSTEPGFATQYYENSYIELETEIWPNVSDPDADKNLYGDRFLMFWVDGIPAGVKAYPTSEKFTHLSPKPITIGSDLCDVYIYVMKVYERRLTENEHLDNFIMDAPSTNEMMSRYRRNNITDNTGEISYEKLVQNNPDCHAYVYRIPHMTTSKDDKVKGCDYFELYGDYNTINNPYYKAVNTGDGARIRVQGTSSAAYGVAAFNLRTEFQEGLIDKDGNSVDAWEISPTAIPIDYVCTKVNVASCENANNVVNQEWYNRFQPYHDAHRRKTRSDGKVYRDTMEFNSGVVFVLDENPVTNYYGDDGKPSRDGYLNANVFLDTKNYTTKPYYKMYAIGNMGNDKKNTHVFHDESNPKACCIEITDNQNAEHWMTVPTDMGTFDLEDLFYEFRYPDGNSEASTEQKQGWVDFVNWMAASNPNAFDDSKVLKATAVPITATNYKNNVYFILNEDGYYEKAVGAFDSSKTYYNITSGTQVEGEPLINVVFTPYTFKGFDPPGFEGKENPTGISLKGTTINTYSSTKTIQTPKLDEFGNEMYDANGEVILETTYQTIPYTHDTFEYRMAKMLSECEDHLVMDSVVFHYLFIQRHTMVDNVAKNTFWSSEDLIHWDLTKDYDNDTSDGNDNSGYLSFTYGIEALDKDEVGDDIYNAAQSVWINFIHHLPEAQKTLYKALEGKGAWDAKAYLAEFNKHQSPIPERCWIYDYFRKYIRPRRLGLDENTYLNRLEGGKKTHQRTQYETYQEFYINSKYMSGTLFTQSAAIDLRLNTNPNGEWDVNNKLPASFYVDCYASCYLGGRTQQSQRLKRGQTYSFPVGTMVQSPHDATCYIYGANMVQTLAGLSEVYPNYASLATAAKLREIEFGSDAEGYYNANLTSPNIGSNAMLQNVYIQNSGVPTGMGELNLTKASQLRELKLNGSTTTSLALADGSVIELMYLNALSTLTISNLTKLSDIKLDEGIYSSLKDISVKNCPAFDPFSYELALRAPINYYIFNDFTWTINVNTTKHFEYENGNVVGIKVLDKLLKTNIQQGATNATAMIGKIIIDAPCSVDEYAIYEKYAGIDKYPNVIIEYTDKVTKLEPKAVELKFMGSEDANAAVFYRVLGRKGQSNIGHLISAEGPTGVAITDPSKSDTSEFTYTFTGYWKDDNSNLYYVDGLENPDTSAKNFNSVIPEDNMVFYPIFTEEKKKHAIKFFDYDGNVILQNGEETFGVPYGMTYAEAKGPMTNFYYKDSSSLPENKRYGFKGWSTSRFKVDEGKNVEFIDLNTYVIKKAMNLYPYYVTEDVHKVATSEEYFNISNGVISLKDQYRNTLQGKITIPTTVNGTKVQALGDFANGYQSQSKITHVYFLDNSAVVSVNISAFAYCRELLVVDLPATVRDIGGSAFTSCEKLTTVTLNDNITMIGSSAFSGCSSLSLTALPTSLKTIGGSAFQNGGPGVQITSLPVDIEVIPSWTFNGCSNVKISEFGGGSSKLKEIGISSFSNAGTGSAGAPLTEIIIEASVDTIGANAFKGYGGSALTNAYFAYDPWEITPDITEDNKPEGYYGSNTPTDMGIDESKVNIGIIERG